MAKYINTDKRKHVRKGSFFLLIETWNLGVQVVVGTTQKEYRAIASKRYPWFEPSDKDPGIDQYCCPGGQVLSYDNGDCVLFLKFWPQKIYDYGVLNHEIFHIVHRGLEAKGIKLSDDSHEAYAYLTEDLTRRLMIRLSKPEKK